MTSTISFTEFFGFDNPFSLAPEEKEKIWADQKELKEKLENIIKISLMTSPTKLIIYYGDWGSGKTHAMRYFTNEGNLLRLFDEPLRLSIPLTITLISPRNQAFNTFYIKIIESIYPKLVKAVKEIDAKLSSLRDPKLLQSELNKYIKNKNLVKVLSQVTNTRKEMLVEKYLLMTARGTEIDRLGVPRGIETYTDMIETLSNIFTFLMELNGSNLRIIIWIDEGEHVFTMPSKDLLEFQTFLRDLIDHIPRNLLVLINVSLRLGEKIQDFIEYLGDPVKTRISRIISSPELKPEEATQYVEDYFLVVGENPFKNKAIDYAINIISKQAKDKNIALTPRLINVAFSNILEVAYSESTKKITKDFIKSIEDKLIDITFSQHPSAIESLL